MVNTQQYSYSPYVSPIIFYNNLEFATLSFFKKNLDLEILEKLAISQTIHFWENFTQPKMFVLINIQNIE